MKRIEEERHFWLQFAAYEAERNNDPQLKQLVPSDTRMSNKVPVRTIKNYLQNVEASYFKKSRSVAKFSTKCFLKSDAKQKEMLDTDTAYTLKRPEMVKLWKAAGLTAEQTKTLVEHLHSLLAQKLETGELHTDRTMKMFKEELRTLAKKDEIVASYLALFCNDEESFNQFVFWYMSTLNLTGLAACANKPVKTTTTIPEALFNQVCATLFQYWLYSILPYYANIGLDFQIKNQVMTRTGKDVISYYLDGGQACKMPTKLVKFVLEDILGLETSATVNPRFLLNWDTVSEALNALIYKSSENLRGSYITHPYIIAFINSAMVDQNCKGSVESYFLTPHADKFLREFLSNVSADKIQSLSPEDVLLKNILFSQRKTFDSWDVYFAEKISGKPLNIYKVSPIIHAWGVKFMQPLQISAHEINKAEVILTEAFTSEDCSITSLRMAAKKLGFGWCGLSEDIPKNLQDRIIKAAHKEELFCYILKQGLTRELAKVLEHRKLLFSSLAGAKNVYDMLAAIKNKYPRTWKNVCEKYYRIAERQN